MLQGMLVEPKRELDNVDFEFDPLDGSLENRSKIGVRAAQAEFFILQGFLNFQPKTFVAKFKSRPKVQKMNDWIQHRRVRSSPIDHLIRLPQKLELEIHRHLFPNICHSCPMSSRKLVYSHLNILLISRDLMTDILHILYGEYTFQFYFHLSY